MFLKNKGVTMKFKLVALIFILAHNNFSFAAAKKNNEKNSTKLPSVLPFSAPPSLQSLGTKIFIKEVPAEQQLKQLRFLEESILSLQQKISRSKLQTPYEIHLFEQTSH